MTFDARSKERLEALGRTLPKKLPLPLPETPAAPRTPDPRAGGERAPSRDARLPRPQAQRHALEQEQDPAKLFRALITASADGSVPPHLLDRLREIEGGRGPAADGSAASPTSAASKALAPSSGTPSQTKAAGPRPGGNGGKGVPSAGNRRVGRKSSRIVANEDQDLYTAFAQLLLEDDDG